VRTYCFDTPQNHVVKHPFSALQAVFVFNIPRSELQNGHYFINCIARIKKNGKKRSSSMTIFTERQNFRFPALFGFFLAGTGVYFLWRYACPFPILPKPRGIWGAPSIIDLFSQCRRQRFFPWFTDHSYDLACAMEDYLKIDPSLSRWKSIRAGIFEFAF